MKTTFMMAPLALVLAAAPQIASADVVTTYDTSAAGGQGFYNGTGNSDGSFTTTTADYATGSIVLSLRGAHRYVGPISPVSNNDYVCQSGWDCNFEYAVATTGTFTIGDFNFGLIVNDLTTSRTASFDPSGASGPPFDDAYLPSKTTSGYAAADTGFENSEFLGFSFLNLAWNPTDQVVVTLSATPKNSLLADPSVVIGFNNSPAQVPEPASIALGLTVIGLCLGGLRRHRKA